MKPTVVLLPMLLSAAALCAATVRPCASGISLDTFQLQVQPPNESPKPLRIVNRVLPGYKLLYKPAQPGKSREGRVAVIYTRRETDDLELMESKRADQPAEWTLPSRVVLLGMVYGPQGLDLKKVGTLLKKDKQLVAQLADYADQTAQTEALIEALSSGTPGTRNLGAAVNGFASRYSAGTTKIDPNAPFEQQALVLMQNLNPALSSYDPLAPEPRLRMEQSAGLAASVAGLFFGGNAIGLAAGSASMFLNLRTMMFPDTEFRSSFTQLTVPGDNESPLALCAKREAVKARTRLAYLWAAHLADAEAPALSLPPVSNIPVSLKSAVPATSDDWKLLDRARDWQLERTDGTTAVPIPVRILADRKALELDLSKAGVSSGSFRLSGGWDWTRFVVPGAIALHPLPDNVALAPEAGDKLVSGTGPVTIEVQATDLQFTEKVVLRPALPKAPEIPLEFKLPKGPRGGPQPTLSVSIDTNTIPPGHYKLALFQPDGKPLDVPIRMLPPNPVLKGLPLRVNLGEVSQTLRLTGTGLDRLEAIEAPGMVITLSPGKPDSREVVVKLQDGVTKGDRPAWQVKVEGLVKPITVPAAALIAGPRPKIASAQLTLPEDPGVAVRTGELPAGTFTSVSLQIENVESRPVLHLQCGNSKVDLTGGEARRDIRMSEIRPGSLFLSLDPAAAGPIGCALSATAELPDTGVSDPHPIGRVVMLPRIDSFELTDQKVSDNVYAGSLIGFDLELVEKAGWNDQEGYPVQGLPVPVAGEGQKQTLKISLPWPPPAPKSPLYLWLRGDTQGRASKLRY